MILINNKNNFHIGCGYTIGKNWFNYDNSLVAAIERVPILKMLIKLNNKKFPQGLMYGNIVKNLLCAENTADNIYCSHVLEHVPLNDGKKILRNIYRMLKTGGILRIIVPSLEARVKKYIQNKDAHSFIQSLGCFKNDENDNFLKKLRFLFGASRHKWMFDKNSLYDELKDAGFDDSKIRVCEFSDSGLDIFSEVEDKDRFIESNGELKAVAFHCVK